MLLSWLGERAFLTPMTDGGGSEYADEEHQSPRLSPTPHISQIESVHIIRTGLCASAFLGEKQEGVSDKIRA